MKANAPEKIYVSNYSSELTYNWHPERLAVKDIEYTRTDAFIEKAVEWIRNNSHNYANNALGKEYLVNDFKNYMEGE